MAYDEGDKGFEQGWQKPDFDDSAWRDVATWGNTLNAQGLPDIKSFLWYRTSVDVPHEHGRLSLFFAEIDGQAVTVYLNGKEVAALGRDVLRKPFQVDLADTVVPGRNVVAVKIDHRKITELFLGGIVRPILLIDRSEVRR